MKRRKTVYFQMPLFVFIKEFPQILKDLPFLSEMAKDEKYFVRLSLDGHKLEFGYLEDEWEIS